MTDTRRSFLGKVAAGALGAGGLIGASSTASASGHYDDYVPAASSNYTSASRGAGEIDWIVVHATAGSFQSALNVFRDPSRNASAHYVVRNSDGYVVKMLDDSDIGWHAGNSGYNRRSIGIEFENADPQLRNDYSANLYREGARIVRHIASKYDVPLDRVTTDVGPCSPYNGAGLIEHAQIPDPDNCSAGGGASRHWDPGPNWDWGTFMSYVRDGGGGGGGGGGSFADGDLVQSTVDLNTRRRPDLDSVVVDTVPRGEDAQVVNGPVSADGYTWWGLHWNDRDVWGWSVEPYLEPRTFNQNDPVHSTTYLNTRRRPGTYSSVVDTVPPGANAEVVNGPVSAEGYTWWGLHWVDRGVWGWSVESYLDPGHS